MTFSNDKYLPGDKRKLYSIFFNSCRSGFVSETVGGATRYASNLLEPMEGYLNRSQSQDMGELAASGKIGSISVDIILEEWTIGENGSFEPVDMLYTEIKH